MKGGPRGCFGVGLRGARVKNIVRELNNEKVDIIRWKSDPAEFVRRGFEAHQGHLPFLSMPRRSRPTLP